MAPEPSVVGFQETLSLLPVPSLHAQDLALLDPGSLASLGLAQISA